MLRTIAFINTPRRNFCSADCDHSGRVLGSILFFEQLSFSGDAERDSLKSSSQVRFIHHADSDFIFVARHSTFGQTAVTSPAKSASKKASQSPTKSSPQRPNEGGVAALEADQQRQVGKIFYADGHVDVRYQNYRIRADHAEYNSETGVVNAKGNVQLDYLTQHVEADDLRYELQTGHATTSPRARHFRLAAPPYAHAPDQPQPAVFRIRGS